MRVLVVDDHASFRTMAAKLLRAAGCEVVGEAADAASAIAEVSRLSPDLVLLDVMLPDRSGLAVAAELLSGSPAPRVLLTSSRSRSDFGGSSVWPPGCHFLPKHQLTSASIAAVLAEK
jgi:DNA-binding NarL/FixJ family response regulator